MNDIDSLIAAWDAFDVGFQQYHHNDQMVLLYVGVKSRINALRKPVLNHSFTFDLFVKLPSITNERLAWQRGLSAKKTKRKTAEMETRSALNLRIRKGLPMPTGKIYAELTRIIQKGHRLDKSNLPAAFKAIEDGICEVLKVNDGDESKWLCEHLQRKPIYGDKPGLTGTVRVSWY